MSFKLPDEIYSTQILEAVTYEIEQYLQWRRQVNVQKQVGTSAASHEPNRSQEAQTLIDTWAEGKMTIEALEQLLSYVRGLKLPQVHVTLATIPNTSQRMALVQWFRQHVSDQALLSFIADRTILGGIIIRTPNHMIDCSWRTQLLQQQASSGVVA